MQLGDSALQTRSAAEKTTYGLISQRAAVHQTAITPLEFHLSVELIATQHTVSDHCFVDV